MKLYEEMMAERMLCKWRQWQQQLIGLKAMLHHIVSKRDGLETR
jgi:GH15 family glucan-1,4-alpha-glucosidase